MLPHASSDPHRRVGLPRQSLNPGHDKRSDGQGGTLPRGDLYQPRIGLPQAVIDDLFSRADLIIHNGADISYMKTYPSMRQPSSLTTKDLVEWSVPQMVPFHYISTAGVGSFAPGSRLQEASVASTPPPTDGCTGYTACKWASESFLE
ncbi:hypothetical protein F4779DRAFT_611540 [Xylariaceae sp. FL0662B]|nr:hypothetical protein F4779DRAFT_611540 [Xylariaceae sp. FL0662B]